MSETSKPHKRPTSDERWQGMPSDLWLEAHAVCDANRDDMWDWLEDRYWNLVEQFDAALKLIDNLATRKDGDGQLCWCITGVRSGLFLQGDHSKYCENARAMLASNPASEPEGNDAA